MPLVSRWGSKVTTVPAREPKANSPRPITLPSRPIAVDLEPTASSLGALVGVPIPVKDFSIIPQAPAPQPVAPKVKYGVHLQGDSRIDLGIPDVFNFSDQPFTISAWVKLTGPIVESGSYDFLVFSYASPPPSGSTFPGYAIDAYLKVLPGEPRIYFKIYGGINSSGDQPYMVTTAIGLSSAPTPEEWAHLMFSYDGSKDASGMNIWLNGSILDTPGMWTSPDYTGMYTNPGRQLSVGSTSDYYLYNPLGDSYIDDIAIFDRVLSAPEVSALYINGWDVIPNLSPIAYYSCGDAENGLGTSLTNLVSNNTDYAGALIGDATFVQDGAPNGYTI